MKRIYHPYWNWEDYKAGMWRAASSAERKELLPKAIEFTGNAELYGSFMRRVIVEWPIACEHNLTESSMNRLAWVGHAATCLAIGAPEDVTRMAWAHLSKWQQESADSQANDAVNAWISGYERKNQQLSLFLEAQGVSRRNTGSGGFKARGFVQSAKLSSNLSGNYSQ